MQATQTVAIGQTVKIVPDSADPQYKDPRLGQTGKIVETSRGTHKDMAMVEFPDGAKEPFYYTELDIVG